MPPDVSVIMPVYNGEKWIATALEKLSKQTLKNFEVIIVNDGSTDNTQNLAEEFCENDQRFKLYNKENGGVSSARNMGIKKANGYYTIHHDVDDKMPQNALELLYNKAIETDADIIIGNYTRQIGDKIINKNQSFHGNWKELIQGFVDSQYHSSLCNKLMKDSVYEGAKFEENIICKEDLVFMIELILKSKPKIVSIDKTVYHYVGQNDNSITNSYSKKRMVNHKTVINLIENLFGKESISIDMTKMKFKFKLKTAKNGLDIDFENIYREINNHIWSLNDVHFYDKLLVVSKIYGLNFYQNIYLKIRSIRSSLDR